MVDLSGPIVDQYPYRCTGSFLWILNLGLHSIIFDGSLLGLEILVNNFNEILHYFAS